MVQTMSSRVCISGFGVLSPIGNNRKEFLQSLREGRSGIARISSFDASAYRSPFGGEVKDFDPEMYFSKKELRRMDRASQMALVAAAEALDHAGIGAGSIDPARSGVVLGSTLGGTNMGIEYYRRLCAGRTHPSLLLDYPLYSAGSRLCTTFGFTGFNYAISTACSSSNMSIGYGMDLIKSGDYDCVIAGGFDTVSPLTCAGFGVLRNMTDGGVIQPFDKNRKGLLLGEGAGIVVLESEEHCLKRNHRPEAVIMGYGCSSDAYHMTAPDITGNGPALAMKRAIEDGGIRAEDVDYINAHGTATLYNDMIETKAIKKVLMERAPSVAVSSIKSMTGHTLGASGALECIASVLAINNSFLPPTINYETLDPKCDLDYVPNTARFDVPVNVVLSNNFGFGGSNCSILIGKYA